MQRDLTEIVDGTLAGSRRLTDLAQGLRNLATKYFLDSSFRPIKTFLNGTWLEHPLHPVLTDVPVGAWTAAMLLDAADMGMGDSNLGEASGIVTGLGLAAAGATIVTGAMDWTDSDSTDTTVGFAHGLTNTIATAFFALSFISRWRHGWRTRPGDVVLSGLGYVTLTLGAFVGGSLVYRRGLMVNRDAFREGPKDFTPVMAAADLPENQLKRVDVQDQPILLVRRGDQVYAVGAVCSHLGGPLQKGKLEGDTVTCPWHYSRFSVLNGDYLEGPTTSPLPAYDVRINNGQVEVKQSK